eukprot:g2361.t1
MLQGAQRAVLALYAVIGCLAHSRTTCDVSTRGAIGRLGVDDTAALQRVLDDINCEEIVLPADRTFSATALFVRRSDITLTFGNNAKLTGMPAAFREQRPDCRTEAGLEFNWTNWCSLLRVTSTRNFTLRGNGTIAPGGVGGSTPDFYSALHVQSTTGVQLSGGLRIHCTAWWWCTAMHNATNVNVMGVYIDGSTGRDGLDLVNCRRVMVEDSRIEGSDDALCFKTITNDGLDRFPSHDVLVRRSAIGSTWDNAIQFGSASEIDMTNFTIEDVVLTSGRKAGIGIVSMDGARISRLSFRNVTIDSTNVATPLFMKIGNRVDCEDGKGTCWKPGAIGDVNFTDIRARGWGNVSHPKPGHAQAYAPTIEGLNASYRIGPVRFEKLVLEAPGGGTAADAAVDPPLSPLQYQPRYDGRRPSYGLFVRYASDIYVSRSVVRVRAGRPEGRPAVVLDQVQNMQLADVMLCSRANNSGNACQVEARSSTGNFSEGGRIHTCMWRPNTTAWTATGK